jgi:hypothetical protein
MPPALRPLLEQPHPIREATHKKEPLGTNPTALHELPALDEFRNFYYFPQTTLEATDRFIELWSQRI